jgi:GNAT superfamily N-acetyltransferase
MAEVDVIEVESRSQLKDFINIPNRLYADNPHYVTPLTVERLEFFDKRKNPFYRAAKTRLFLAVREGKPVGRIATCVNYRHNEYHHEEVGFFGFFDTPDDWEIAQPLLKVAMITLKKEGMKIMRGPMNFSTNHEIGFLVEGFDMPPAVMMTYNARYQPKLAERFGLTKVMDLEGGLLRKEQGISERIERVVTRLQERSKIVIRTINKSDFDAEVRRINDVYNQAWAPNWGFVPMDETEFFHMAKNLKQIYDPNLVLIAEHEDRPVAFMIGLPDINQALIHLRGKLFPFGMLKLLWHTKISKKINGLRFITMGVVPEYQKRGIDSMLYINAFKIGVAHGYEWAEMSWILETNDLMLRSLEEMGVRLCKRYRITEMPI